MLKKKVIGLMAISLLSAPAFAEDRPGVDTSSGLFESNTEFINRVVKEKGTADNWEVNKAGELEAYAAQLEQADQQYTSELDQLKAERDALRSDLDTIESANEIAAIEAELDSFPHPLAFWKPNLTKAERKRKKELKKQLKAKKKELENLQERYSDKIVAVRDLERRVRETQSNYQETMKSLDQRKANIAADGLGQGNSQEQRLLYASELAFRDMGQKKMDIKFLLTDLNHMETELTHGKSQISALQKVANRRLKDTLIGRYVLDMIKEEFDKRGDSEQPVSGEEVVVQTIPPAAPAAFSCEQFNYCAERVETPQSVTNIVDAVRDESKEIGEDEASNDEGSGKREVAVVSPAPPANEQ